MSRHRKSLTRRKLAGTYKPIQLVSLEERLAEEQVAQGELAVIQAAMDAAGMVEEGNPIDAYTAAVVAGEIPAGRLHRLACARHQRDRERENTAEFPYQLNFAKVARFVAFASCLKHYKGEWAGKVIELQPYQVFRLGSLMGWEHVETGLRRFRTSYNEVPRKNGKSLEAAIVLLYLTFFDGEPGAEGICAATKTGQAQIVFNDCARLVRASGLRAWVNVFAHNLHNEETASKLEPISADSKTTDGLNPNVVSLDEFHAHPDRRLVDVIESGMGARRQPVMYQITTAGNSLISPCGAQHNYAVGLLEETLPADETFFAFIAHADPEDDWTSETAVQKANPNYGVSLYPAYLAAVRRKATSMPEATAEYQQKHLNWWVNTSQPWLSLDGWRKGQTTWTLEDMAHEPCWVGIDLAAKIDLCVAMFVFPPTPGRSSWRAWPMIWTPQETLVERAHRDQAPYDVWARQKHLIPVSGPVSHRVIRQALVKLRSQVDIEQIAFDPWHADQIADELVSVDGFRKDRIVEIPQTFAGMSKAALEFEAAVSDGAFDVAGHPVVTHAASLVVVQRDGKDNIYPVKSKSRGRIDPIVAIILGMAAWLKTRPMATSVYATREAHVL